MKFTSLVSLSLLLSIGSGSFTPIFQLVSINSIIPAGPFSINEDSYIQLFTNGATVKFSIDYYDLFYNSLYSHIDYDCQSMGSIRLPFKNRLTNKGIRGNFKYNLGMKQVEINPVFYPPSYQTINVALLSEKVVVHEGVCFEINDDKYNTKETLDFTNTNRYITTNSKNQIDISDVSFVYSNSFFSSCSKAYLKIYDYENVYPYVNKIGNLIEVPINIYNDKNEIGLSWNSKLYVNSQTLDMSSDPRENYEETTSFYLPIGKESQFSRNEVSLIIEEFGLNKDTIIIPFDYFSSKRLFGACYDSDYCIEGGIKRWFWCF